MRLRDRYKFVLKCGDVEHVATPIYTNLRKVWEQENGEIFFREKLEGDLKFDRADYEFIRSCDFSKQIDITISKANNKGDMEMYWQGYFRKTDCTTDVNHKQIVVKPKAKDRYKLVMDKLNEEYDLMKHNPKMSDVSMMVRPMLQVYELGADYVNCYIGSSFFKIDVTPIYDLADYTDMHLSAYPMCIARPIQIYDSSLSDKLFFSASDWEYMEDATNTHFLYMPCDDGIHRMYIKATQSALENKGDTVYRIGLEKKQSNGEWLIFGAYKNTSANREWMTRAEIESASTIKLYLYGSNTGITDNLVGEFDFNLTTFCSRLLAKMYYPGGYDIADGDIFNTSEIYDKIYKVSIGDNILASSSLSSDVTIFGRVEGEDNLYYVPTDNIQAIDQYEPILEQSWTKKWSFWLKIHDFTERIDKTHSVSKTLKDWISLYEAIRVLLQAIDPNVGLVHESGSSMFLWNKTNPITGMQNQGEIFLLQKSNATKLEYNYSASKAPITLGKILNWLKTFNVYWDIYEVNGKPYMRIEHKLFYMNGGAYVKQNKAEIDLRNIVDTWGGKTFAFETNNWKYEDVNNIPTTIYYKWADEVSMPFEGEAMKVVDNPYGEEHQETRNAEIFTSDIDYIFANSTKINKDGFVVVQGSKASGDTSYAILFYDVDINGRQYHLQNGYLSVAYMQRYYMPYDMPGKQMEITGGEIIESVYTRQLRQNEVKFALPKGTAIDIYSPIATEVGIGTIARLEQELDSEFYTTTLKYDNEQ